MALNKQSVFVAGDGIAVLLKADDPVHAVERLSGDSSAIKFAPLAAGSAAERALALESGETALFRGKVARSSQSCTPALKKWFSRGGAATPAGLGVRADQEVMHVYIAAPGKAGDGGNREFLPVEGDEWRLGDVLTEYERLRALSHLSSASRICQAHAHGRLWTQRHGGALQNTLARGGPASEFMIHRDDELFYGAHDSFDDRLDGSCPTRPGLARIEWDPPLLVVVLFPNSIHKGCVVRVPDVSGWFELDLQVPRPFQAAPTPISAAARAENTDAADSGPGGGVAATVATPRPRRSLRDPRCPDRRSRRRWTPPRPSRRSRSSGRRSCPSTRSRAPTRTPSSPRR